MLSSLDLNRKPSDPITPLAVRFLTIAGLHYKSLRRKCSRPQHVTDSIHYVYTDHHCPRQFGGPTCVDDQYTTGVVLASGTIVPGQGIVPLGLTLGLDDPDSEDAIDQADGTIEYVAGTTGAPGTRPNDCRCSASTRRTRRKLVNDVGLCVRY